MGLDWRKQMNRVAIIGCGGAGKSTLAMQLGERYSIPIFHLDQIFWQFGWRASSHEDFAKAQTKILDRESWIIDGNYSSTIDIRLAAADTILFLDLPTYICLLGAIRRYLKYRKHTRPDMTPGNKERITLDYIRWILSYRSLHRPSILKKLDELKGTKNVKILTGRCEVVEFLDIKKCQPEPSST